MQQHLPFTVLKLTKLSAVEFRYNSVATAPTVYGIETPKGNPTLYDTIVQLQQHLPFPVCAEGGEAAEEQSDEEVRTSQVPEQSEGKTKVI